MRLGRIHACIRPAIPAEVSPIFVRCCDTYTSFGGCRWYLEIAGLLTNNLGMVGRQLPRFVTRCMDCACCAGSLHIKIDDTLQSVGMLNTLSLDRNHTRLFGKDALLTALTLRTMLRCRNGRRW